MTRASILKKHGVKNPRLVIRKAKRAGLRLDYALAMLQNETGIPQKNIFGCDYGDIGNPPYCHDEVTKERVLKLRDSDYSNGIGWTQITYKPLVAYYGGRWGRMHRPSEQMKVGFKHLAKLIQMHGVWTGFRMYNGTGAAAEAYANRAIDRAKVWHDRLN